MHRDFGNQSLKPSEISTPNYARLWSLIFMKEKDSSTRGGVLKVLYPDSIIK